MSYLAGNGGEGGGGSNLITTTSLYVDCNRPDSYTENGTVQFPFKKISTAITYGNALGSPGAAAYSLNIASGVYTDSTVPTVTQALTILGNNSTYTIGGGSGTLTLGNLFNIYGITIIGNVIQSNTSLMLSNHFHESVILGNLTVLGYLSNINSTIAGNGVAPGLITIGSISNSSAICDCADTILGIPPSVAPGNSTNFCTRVINYGTFYMVGADIYGYDNSNYVIDSSASGSNLYTQGVRVFNLGAGKGINCNNGATVANSNGIVDTDINIVGSTNGLDCGSASVNLIGYILTYNYGSTFTSGLAIFTNPSTSFFGTIQSRKVPRTLNIISDANPTINTNLYDCVVISALSTNISSFTTNLTGTPLDFERLTIRIKDDGIARLISWGTSFIQKGVSLPVTTIPSKSLKIFLEWDTIVGKWGCTGVAQEY